MIGGIIVCRILLSAQQFKHNEAKNQCTHKGHHYVAAIELELSYAQGLVKLGLR